MNISNLSKIKFSTFYQTSKLGSFLSLRRCFSVSPLNLKPSTQGQTSQKVYELRTYNIHPKDFHSYLNITYEKFQLRTKHSKLIGYWTTEIGGLNEVVHLWEYDSYKHRSEVRAKLAGDATWMNEYVSKVSPMWQKQVNMGLVLFSWSSFKPPKSTGVYELQVYDMIGHKYVWQDRLKAAIHLSEKTLAPLNSSLVGVFKSIFGPHNIAIALWQHENFDKCAESRIIVMNEPNSPIMNAFYHEVEEAHSKGLAPTKISPLQ